jgi:3-hydroxyacyl-CoA dehydrogenase
MRKRRPVEPRKKVLASKEPPSQLSGWRSVFGCADPKAVKEIDEIIEATFESVDPSDWR